MTHSHPRFAKVRWPAISGRSPAIQQLTAKIEKISRYCTNVLLLGESGTGKELVAHAIHSKGPRRDARFEPQNCATLSAELLASELFGHEQGAFTGAHTRKMGLIEVADGGTLLLDEVAEIDLSVQAKLLRVLEMRRFRRLGATAITDVDISVIAATNRSLPSLVTEGRFRADLYYRLKVVTIVVPALRDRQEDIPLLADVFVHDFNERNGTRLTGVSDALMERFLTYAWPGNVRELRNTIESMAVVADDVILGEREAEEAGFGEGDPLRAASRMLSVPATATLEEAERILIVARMKALGSRAEVARSLGIGLRTLYSKLRAIGET